VKPRVLTDILLRDLPGLVPYEVLHRLVEDHLSRRGSEEILECLVALCNVGEEKHDQLAAKWLHLLGALEEDLLCKQVITCGQNVQREILRNGRLGSLRSLARRGDLSEQTIQSLLQHPDREVRVYIHQTIGEEVADQDDIRKTRAGSERTEKLGTWLYRDVDYLEWFLKNGPKNRVKEFQDFSYMPERGLKPMGEQHLIEVLRTSTNLQAGVRQGLENYILRAEISKKVHETIVSQWNMHHVAEFNKYIEKHCLRKVQLRSEESELFCSISRCSDREVSREWSDESTFQEALNSKHGRNLCLRSQLLSGESLLREFNSFFEKNNEPLWWSNEISREAASLCLNPNLSIEYKRRLAARINRVYTMWLYGADLDFETRGILLALNPMFVKNLDLLHKALLMNNKQISELRQWVNKDTVEHYLQKLENGGDFESYSQLANLALELDNTCGEALVSGVRTYYRLEGEIARLVVVQVAGEINKKSEDGDTTRGKGVYKETFSGLLNNWHGTLGKLLKGSRKLTQ
jgi:hypothetical protein